MKIIEIQTDKRNVMVDITSKIQDYLDEIDAKDGIITVFSPHTTAAITINENADPDVQHDILTYLSDKIPQDGGFRHIENNSDSHIKTSLVGPSQQIIVKDGELVLGMWQSIYFCEFDGPRQRKFYVAFM